MSLEDKKKWKKRNWCEFVVCPKCGYNNEPKRFNSYGTCLRCHQIVNPKIYLKRKLWEAKYGKRLKEEDYYE